MYRNNEHYPDPTFETAYKNIRADGCKHEGRCYVPWVYIASPYRGDAAGNIRRARKYSRFAVANNKIPLCPHIYFTQFLDDNIKSERDKGLCLAIQMLKRCKEVWVFGDKISEGMKREIRIARKRNMVIRYFTNECEEVTGK